MRALALVLLAGCGLVKTSSSGSSTMPTASPAEPAPAPAPAQNASEGAPAPSDGQDHFHGMLVRHQLEPLRGMTVDAGKAELARLGYHAAIQIDHPVQFIDKCGLGKICDIEPEDGLSLTDPTAVMHFTVNEDTVKISTPDQ